MSDRLTRDALVIGAGVTGLTTAVCLSEAGFSVEVWTAEPPEATTSAAAGAMWGPYLTEPRDLIRQYSLTSLRVFTELAKETASGITLVSGIEAGRTLAEPPDWADMLPDFRLCTESELPDGFASGWRFTAPIVDMPAYLRYLQDRLVAADGSVHIRRVDSVNDATHDHDLVINCTGYGSRAIGDPSVTSVRGDLIVVDQPDPPIEEFFSEETGLASDLMHIYPQPSHLILGGTALPGRDSRDPDPAIAQGILERCAEVEPRLKGVAIREHRVGLRPTRPMVRLEPEHVEGSMIIHNYGHGGSGVTLSWGCANQVLNLARQLPYRHV